MGLLGFADSPIAFCGSAKRPSGAGGCPHQRQVLRKRVLLGIRVCSPKVLSGQVEVPRSDRDCLRQFGLDERGKACKIKREFL